MRCKICNQKIPSGKYTIKDGSAFCQTCMIKESDKYAKNPKEYIKEQEKVVKIKE